MNKYDKFLPPAPEKIELQQFNSNEHVLWMSIMLTAFIVVLWVWN